MLDLFLVIFLCSLYGYIIQSRSNKYGSVLLGVRRDGQAKLFYVLILITVILFAGLRTTNNDTSTYMDAFIKLDIDEIHISTLFESYGGFELYQKLIKKYISEDPQVMIFLSAVIENALLLRFLRRHTKSFGPTMFFFMIGNFIFGMAAIKQVIAMAISTLAIDAMMEKHYIRALIWLLIAMTFHPYIICLVVLLFLRREPWKANTVVITILIFACAASLTFVLNFAGIVGQEYSTDTMTDHTINPFRVAIEAIPIVIAFLFRNRIQKQGDRWLNLGINMMIVDFLFSVISLFYNPIYFARVGNYFNTMSAIATPLMLRYAFGYTRSGRILRGGYYVLFSIYFLLDMTSLGTVSILHDNYNHTTIMNLLQAFGLFAES